VQTQKDHVEAHSFLVGRMTSALVTGDDSFLEVPARRAWKGLIIGAVLGVLVVAGFFVFGLIVPAHKAAPPAQPVRAIGITMTDPAWVNRIVPVARVDQYPVTFSRSFSHSTNEG
jgi:hypothetical protein